jgi:hypothetical protein
MEGKFIVIETKPIDLPLLNAGHDRRGCLFGMFQDKV